MGSIYFIQIHFVQCRTGVLTKSKNARFRHREEAFADVAISLPARDCFARNDVPRQFVNSSERRMSKRTVDRVRVRNGCSPGSCTPQVLRAGSSLPRAEDKPPRYENNETRGWFVSSPESPTSGAK